MKTIAEKMKDLVFMAGLAKTRAEAKQLGAKYYYTGLPCAQGHDSYKRVANGSCAKCQSLVTQKLITTTLPEKLQEIRAKCSANWNASNKGVAAKQRWKEKDPKWAWVVSAVGGARIRAKAYGYAFNLTNEYVYNITPDECPVFKHAFTFIGAREAGVHLSKSASLDRINPKLGYTQGNVAVISVKANAIKSDATVEEINAVLIWLANYY